MDRTKEVLVLRLLELTGGLAKVDYKEGLVYYDETQYAHWTEHNPALENKNPLEIINTILELQGAEAKRKERQERRMKALKELVEVTGQDIGIIPNERVDYNSVINAVERALIRQPQQAVPAWTAATWNDAYPSEGLHQ